MLRLFLCLSASIMLMGCVTNRPIVDTKGINMTNYEVDLRECQTFAEQKSVGEQTAVGALAGAAAGAILSKWLGGNSKVQSYNTKAGAIAGGAGGASEAMIAKKQIVNNCLSGRGYKVLY